MDIHEQIEKVEKSKAARVEITATNPECSWIEDGRWHTVPEGETERVSRAFALYALRRKLAELPAPKPPPPLKAAKKTKE